MEWAIENGSANVLTHLTELAYPIPEDLVMKYQEVIADYLFAEHPLRVRDTQLFLINCTRHVFE